MQRKILYFLSAIFAIATLISGYTLIKNHSTDTVRTVPTIPKIERTDEEHNTSDTPDTPSSPLQKRTTLEPDSPPSNTQSETTTAPAEEKKREEIIETIVTITIDEKNLSIPYHENMTAESAMREARARYPESFQYEGIEYGRDLGTFVTSINGKKENTKENMRWILYINGTASNKGISTLKLNPNDIITWNYEKETL